MERTTDSTLPSSNGPKASHRRSRKPKPLPGDLRIDSITIVSLDGKVYARLYRGAKFIDAVIPYGCLANMVADGAKMLAQLYQKES